LPTTKAGSTPTASGAIRYAPDQHGWLLFDHNDKLIGEAEEDFDPRDLAESDVTIVPAAHDQAAILVYSDAPDGQRPVRENIAHERVQVLAWKISADIGAAFPIFLPHVRGDLLLILFKRADGKLIDIAEEGAFGNLDEAKRAALALAQAEFDHPEADAGGAEPPAQVH
jgi:hypothetical protein